MAFDIYVDSVTDWWARRARNPAVLGSIPALTTIWICFTAVPSSHTRPLVNSQLI